MMTRRLQEAIKRVQELPEPRQDEIADMLLDLAGRDRADSMLSEAQWTEIRRRLSEPREYASDAEVEAFFKRYVR
jgi:hypothetical protein